MVKSERQHEFVSCKLNSCDYVAGMPTTFVLYSKFSWNCFLPYFSREEKSMKEKAKVGYVACIFPVV